MERMTKDRPNRSGHPWPITLDQCAERLHIGRRTLQMLLKDHPFYRRAGRRILFTREDFKKLLDALPTGESEYRSVGWRQSARRYSNERRADPPGRPARTHHRARHRVVPASGVWERLGARRHPRAARPGLNLNARRALTGLQGVREAATIHPWQGEGAR